MMTRFVSSFAALLRHYGAGCSSASSGTDLACEASDNRGFSRACAMRP
jgi:hypothetical protein